MDTGTLVSVLIAVFVSLGAAIYMYGYRSELDKGLKWTFGTLRFLSIFILLLIFINPEFRTTTYKIVKPSLGVAIDNSQSVRYLGKSEEVKDLAEYLKSDKELNDHFDLSFYTFGNSFNAGDSLDFSEKQTNLSAALRSLSEIYKNEVAPTIWITDGNQTYGPDYEFLSTSFNQPSFSVVAGDTITYTDLRITQLNVNRYSFLKNDFPVEIFTAYSGTEEVSSTLEVKQGQAVVHRQVINFSTQKNTNVLNFTLPANRVGVNTYSAELIPLENERNTDNNRKNFATEVIDQATQVLIISDLVHPDIGALSKSITSNKQRKVTVKKPVEALDILNDFQLVLLYQPNSKFRDILQRVEESDMNSFTISGLNTDWDFLNTAQKDYKKLKVFSREDVQGVLNPDYAAFTIEDIGFNNFPPLKTTLGDMEITTPYQVLLQQQINNFTTENPLLFSMEDGSVKKALLNGEGIWKWRANSYLKDGNFQKFDNFIASLVQYLASKKQKSRLELDFQSFYYSTGDIKIKAQYFDKNYNFDNRASLLLSIKNAETGTVNNFPLLLKNNFYEASLDNLTAGDYSFTVSAEGEKIASSGEFTVIDFNVEQQFLNANTEKLNRFAEKTGGKVYYLDQGADLVQELINDKRFSAIEKSEQKTVPLLDWRHLLFALVFLLALEWFLRKYHGLI